MFVFLRINYLIVLLLGAELTFGRGIAVKPDSKSQNLDGESLQVEDAKVRSQDRPEDVPPIVLPDFKFFENPMLYIDSKQRGFSRDIIGMAARIDSFFGEDNYTSVNKSRIKIDLTTLFVEGEIPKNLAKIKARLSLPRTQKKLNLVVDSIASPVNESANKQDPTKGIEEENFSASLRYFFRNDRYWNFSTDAGIVARIPLDPFAKLYLKRRFYLAPWILQLSEDMFWFKSDGFGEITTISLSRPVFSDKLLFTVASEATYLETIDRLLLVQSISLSQKLNEISWMVYGASAAGENKPTVHINSYTIYTSYRRKLYRNWLFLEVTPSGSWVRPKRFGFTPAIQFKIEILIGKT